MSVPLVERILGSNSLHTQNYLDKTLLLTKSIVLVNNSEATLYNDLVQQKYSVQVDKGNKRSWRYYLHLAGDYHQVDVAMRAVSWDNGEEIILDKESIYRHRATREELLKFGSYYRSIVDAYPEQELLLKSIINTTDRLNINQILELPNHSIISYNLDLVEPQETNLIPRLQERIHHYSISKALPYYALAENLYMAAMYFVLYQFIFMSIINLRLANAKTESAHSYHILNYLASHHRLDNSYPYLDRRQTLFLYRNLKYLNSHAGTNEVFYKLIDKFFTVRRVSVVNYQYKQKNTTDDTGAIEYRFVQKLLNDDNLVFDTRDYSLSEIADKEATVEPGNVKEYFFHSDEIDFKNQQSLEARLATKDLEISIVDNSEDVKHKLLPTTLDYWAQSLNLGINNHLVNFTDPIRGYELSLDSGDAFKLFTVLLHLQAGQRIETIPDYYISRVIRPQLPSNAELLNRLYKISPRLRNMVDDIRVATPRYSNIDSVSDFNNYVLARYKYNLGTWLYLSNIGDKHTNAQMEMVIEQLHYNTIHYQDSENVGDFIRRISFPEVMDYTQDQLFTALTGLIKTVSMDLASSLERNKHVQNTLIEVLDKFKSYSTQIINQYNASEATLTNLEFPYFTLDDSAADNHIYYDLKPPIVNLFNSITNLCYAEVLVEVQASSSSYGEIEVDIGGDSNYDGGIVSDIIVNLMVPSSINEENADWVITPADQDHLLFLSMQP